MPRGDRRRLGKRLLAAASAILLVAIMILAYTSSITGNNPSPVPETSQTSSKCRELWGPLNLNATLLPSNPNVLFTLEVTKSSEAWRIAVYIKNNGTTSVDLPWLASEGLSLVVYNSIGAIAGRGALKAQSVPILSPGDTITLAAKVTPVAGAPLPLYIAVFNPSHGVAMGSWLDDPFGFYVACGMHSVKSGDASVLFRWLHTVYGLTVVEAALSASSSITVEELGRSSFNLTLTDPDGSVVASFSGIRLNNTLRLRPGQVLVLGALASYTTGEPSTVNLNTSLNVDGISINGYSGFFANIEERTPLDTIWSYSSITTRNASLAVIIDYAYNGYILAIRSVKLVAASNATLELNSSYPVNLFGTPLPGVQIRLIGGLGGSVIYAFTRLGENSGISLVHVENGTFTFRVRSGSYTLTKLLDLSGITTTRESFTIFYAPKGSSPQLTIVAPWGAESYKLG